MKLELRHVGPINEANLVFGDLTALVGPQASGKSIALQMLKLVVDAGNVQETMRMHGLDWSGKLPEFFDAYFGEGMRGIWNDAASRVAWNGLDVDMPNLVAGSRPNKEESLFYMPAQRVLALRDGWPRPFSGYSPGDPFAVRDFSEKLRDFVEKEFRGTESLFPQERRLKSEFREMLERTIFANFQLKVDKVQSQRRFVLGAEGEPLPFMVWSAGQREFVPLLVGMYWLMPATKPMRENLEWVVLEEPEMGLHPRAVSVVMLLVMELVARGYRVCISTHSPQVLEAIWALRHLTQNQCSPDTLLTAFDAPKTAPMRQLAKSVMAKNAKVYYFDAASGNARDISALDPAAEELGEAGWGGLLEFSGRANALVADAVANA